VQGLLDRSAAGGDWRAALRRSYIVFKGGGQALAEAILGMAKSEAENIEKQK
jgi:hypothetical protein